MSGGTLTWLCLVVALALFGARAWVVETNRGRLNTAGAAQRGLTWAVAASVALLVLLATVNGGITLFGMLVDGQAQTAPPADSAPVAPQPAAPVNP